MDTSLQLNNKTQYALCDGEIICITNVTEDFRKHHKFYCPGCGKEMEACLGKKVMHYFRHKEKACSHETYLHELSKHLIKYRFENEKHLMVSYHASNICEYINNCNFHLCKKEFENVIDLKDYYDTCVIEGSHRGFRADVLLTHSKHTERVLFIEIEVTHSCTQEKLNSGIKIIEIKAENELSAFKPLAENEFTKFYNFKRSLVPQKEVKRFIADGQQWELKKCSCIDKQDDNNKHAIDVGFDKDKSDYNIAVYGMSMVIINRLPIKHCLLCIKVKGRCPYIYNGKHPLEHDFVTQGSIGSICQFFSGNQRGASQYIKSNKKGLLWEEVNEEK